MRLPVRFDDNSAPTLNHPRHFLVCRHDGDLLIVGRVLHDAMELRRHVDRSWD